MTKQRKKKRQEKAPLSKAVNKSKKKTPKKVLGVFLTKDGKPNKRFKIYKFLKKDGTPKKRYEKQVKEYIKEYKAKAKSKPKPKEKQLPFKETFIGQGQLMNGVFLWNLEEGFEIIISFDGVEENIDLLQLQTITQDMETEYFNNMPTVGFSPHIIYSATIDPEKNEFILPLEDIIFVGWEDANDNEFDVGFYYFDL